MTSYSLNENETPKPIVPTARKGKAPMGDAKLQSMVSALISDAETLIDSEISPERAQATDYYHGEPFGNEEEGRSQVVITEVRDTLHGTLPSLMRVFFGPERCVEFLPRTAGGVELAKQASDYIQYVFAEDNAGFLRTVDVLKDGLLRKLGIFKWAWDDTANVEAFEEEHVSDDELTELAIRDEVNLLSVVEEKPSKTEKAAFEKAQQAYAAQMQQLQQAQAAQAQQPAPQGAPPGAAGGPQQPPQAPIAPPQAPTMPKHYTVKYTVTKEGRPRVWSVPCDEFLFDREARSLDEATFVGHRRNMKRGELIALGIDEADIDAHGGRDAKLDSNIDAIERKATVSENTGRNPDAGEANDDIAYVEGYYRIDCDGDGIAELRNICTIGPGHYVVHNKPVSERPFSLFTPYPEPHMIQGQSQADLTMDLQLIKSSLTRGMLDSFALSIFPRTTVLEGMASIEDVLNTEIGAPIRIKRDGAVVPFSHAFTGEKAMGILQYFDEVGENRTGRDKGAMGLDADSLQSSTKTAVNAAVTASQEQVEMIARVFAEQAIKPMFRGLYRLMVKHKPAERLVKLRGQYVPINTELWEAEMDVTVNVAIGISAIDQRIATLKEVAAEQKDIIASLGPNNPICTVAQYSNTLRLITELGGFKDPSQFFNAVDPNWQPPAAEPQKTPEQTIAEAQLQMEQMRTQKDLEIKQAELLLKQQDQAARHDLEIKKLAQDYTLRRYQIDAQFKADYQQADLDRDSAAEETALTSAMDIMRHQHERQQSDREHALAQQDQQHSQGLAEQAQDHDQQMAEQQQQQAATPGATE